ncbi:MAG TPA: phenylalanine--tRNA ligase beta subunit-related protein [Paludibacter sp.]|nr:phenylalanine--tRNA ligase beta subunit-related protein [Paludibacter sp.]
MNIQISTKIQEACPQLALAIITCEVTNSATSNDFWHEMDAEIQRFKSSFSIEEINKRPEIAATRKAYKTLGKDPNRYRPSAEALCRRIVREIPIYRVSTLVDIINLVSIRSGFSIGGFDKNKIQGDIELGVGTNKDEFEAIGRGLLNVEGLPLYRDQIGGIGTPTSDNERTKISDGTTSLLMIINGYNGKAGLQEAANHAIELLGKYAKLKEYELMWLK